jgi:retinol dehydrogenase-14
LTNLLLDLLKASAPSRVVNVSSASHYSGHLDLDQIRRKQGSSGYRAYSDSKLALVLFTYELARRLHGTSVVANCLHPGVVATKMWRLPPALTKPFMLSAEKGAETVVYLASAPEAEKVTGEYFENCQPKASSKDSHDEGLARDLWLVSSELVGIHTDLSSQRTLASYGPSQ